MQMKDCKAWAQEGVWTELSSDKALIPLQGEKTPCVSKVHNPSEATDVVLYVENAGSNVYRMMTYDTNEWFYRLTNINAPEVKT